MLLSLHKPRRGCASACVIEWGWSRAMLQPEAVRRAAQHQQAFLPGLLIYCAPHSRLPHNDHKQQMPPSRSNAHFDIIRSHMFVPNSKHFYIEFTVEFYNGG
jgi:hypothetical protein